MNSKLQEAVAIFKALGWEKANSDNVLDLPTGTPEQKKTALAGLKSGAWFAFQGEEGRLGGLFDVNAVALAAFAIRVGVEAQRVVSALTFYDNKEYQILENAIISRGKAYANQFIVSACIDRYRPFVNAPSRDSMVAVALVHDFPMTVPHNAGYIKDWIACCAPNQHGWGFDNMQITSPKLLQKVKQRFPEHIQIAVEVGASATGPMKELLKWGIEEKCISKEKLQSLAFAALNTPIRPNDRKVWLEVLDMLNVSDKEFCNHMEELLPVLSLGEAPIINRLAPVYIKNAKDTILVSLLIASLSGKTNKTRKIVLEAALERKCPPQAELLSDWLTQLCMDADAKISKLAQKLVMDWKLKSSIKQKEDTVQDGTIHGYWQETPPLWTVPDFTLGEVTSEALTQKAGQLMGQAAVTYDITTEQFFAMANQLAYQDPEEVRLSLRGLSDSNERNNILLFFCCWVKKESLEFARDIKDEKPQGLLPARDYMVISHLGQQPCLLSTPSKEDLSITAKDLMARLKLYQQVGAKALEADLYLAMTRLIPKKMSEESKIQWQNIDVVILSQNGKAMKINAGQAVCKWLSNPLQEPALKMNKEYLWWRCESNLLDAPGFPSRLSKRNLWSGDELYAIFPQWGDSALMEVVQWSDNEVNHYQGLHLRQVARHYTPFSANVMMNFLAAQRSILAKDAAEDSRLAVMEAWERGLLRPGSVDINKFDWSARTPVLLAAFAIYLDEIAQQGLLSLVWSVADPLILASCQAPRMFSGTKELVELIYKYLPEAMAAVKNGIGEPIVLNLPGIRMLAARKGSSGAVCAARKVTEQLPPVI